MTMETLFAQASERGASDLHLVVGLPPIIRLHGELKPLDEAVLTPKKMEELIGSLLQPAQQARFAKQGGHLAVCGHAT